MITLYSLFHNLAAVFLRKFYQREFLDHFVRGFEILLIFLSSVPVHYLSVGFPPPIDRA